jgi:hypothetical protein
VKLLCQGDLQAEDSRAEQSARITQPQVTLLLLNILMQQSSVSTFGLLKMMVTAIELAAYIVDRVDFWR